jgi:hypothetical protein
MKFYPDENLRPKIAEIMKILRADAITAHEVEMTRAADEEQLDLALGNRLRRTVWKLL